MEGIYFELLVLVWHGVLQRGVNFFSNFLGLRNPIRSILALSLVEGTFDSRIARGKYLYVILVEMVYCCFYQSLPEQVLFLVQDELVK